MTATTTDFSGLLYYNPAAQGFNPIVEATMTGPTSIDEGATATFDAVAWGIPDGPVYWWVTNLTNVTTDRITPGLAAEATIENNRSSFSVTVNANNTTATGAQSYIVKFGKVNGTALATTTVTVNDTSQTPSGGNKVISLNPNYIALNGGGNIPNEVDSGSSAAALSAPFTGTLAQNGTLNFTGLDSALLLPAKNIKTIGMWIKLTSAITNTRYLLDSREIGTGSGNGYIYSAGQDRWTSMSINGAPAGDSNWPTYWNTIVNNINTWQYVIVINQTAYTNSITLFNRHTLGESLANVQVGWVEAWDYALNDTEINTVYQAHVGDYTIATPNARQITVGYAETTGAGPSNYTITLYGVPESQWLAIRLASAWKINGFDGITNMTYQTDTNTGTFVFYTGTRSGFQGDSFWYVP